ncbi:hypothetical protein [Clostridium ljungdahlii]|uniref:Uncharacterized protein n=1 Tax=Clostridium ljungdahlii TaxID=1538 RepID=A0A168MH09_9CLOT|nr:hypothetical protein [Clostridium ljungdahlii]OAA84677.1 hypothetical protein WY13_02576 [Clostridium ljungdahlii]
MNIIQSISSKGIEYLNEETKLIEFIDFQICNNNWIEYRIIKQRSSDIESQKIRKRDRNVGQRDSFTKSCYIKFFTKPSMIKIEFNSIDDFQNIRDAIIEHGWNTLDLS